MQQPTLDAARALLGCFVVRQIDGQRRIGRIVESEAYLGPHDLACHTSRGRTPRTEPMFGPAAHAYVYFIYGMHHCLNVVSEGYKGAAILVRALEPIEGYSGSSDGPGKLCRALAIDKTFNVVDLTRQGALWIAQRVNDDIGSIETGPRVGVAYAGEWAKKPYRFWLAANPHVSRAR